MFTPQRSQSQGRWPKGFPERDHRPMLRCRTRLDVVFSFAGLFSIRFKIDEDDGGGIADRSVLAREGKVARAAIDTEACDVVTTLIAAIEEFAGGIEVETARIIAPRP